VTTARWLVAGLGNPPPEYAGTRHNVGAEAVAAIADDAGRPLARHRRAGCRTAEVRLAGTPTMLAVPDGYMNTSGGPIQRAMAWYQVPVERLIVCHDDLDLPVGSLRIKQGGGHAGHNGLRDIDRALGSRDYFRIRIGIGRPPGEAQAADHVLRPFASDERDHIAKVLSEVGAVAVSLIVDGLETTQNRHHGRAVGQSQEDD